MDHKPNNVQLPLTLELMRAHRSVRAFKPDPVPAGWLEKIIEAAQWASSTCFRQVYSVIAIEDAQTKRELTKLCGGQKWVEQCPLFLAFCADLNRLADICRQYDEEVCLDHTETFVSAVLDVGLFMQNVALAAEAFGLGMVMIGGLRDHPRQVVELLNLPRGVFGVSGMCVGFAETVPPPRPRLPLEEVLHRETYQAKGRAERLAGYDDCIRAARIYRKDDTVRGWTEVMARTTSKPPGEDRVELRTILQEIGFGME
jgi:FMN reductase (NADPH)